MFYKRNDRRRWHGPGTVLGQLGTIVYVIHGSRVIRCASNRGERKGTNELSRKEPEKEESPISKGDKNESVREKKEQSIGSNEVRNEGKEEDPSGNEQELPSDNIKEGNEEDPSKDEREFPIEKRRRIKPDRYTDTWKKGDLSVEEVNTVIIPPERHNDLDVIQAKEVELSNWFEMEAVDVIEDKGQKLITTRWVITQKELDGGIMIAKARLVIRGFEEEEEHQADAPTAAKLTLRIVLAIAANEDWNIETIDIKAAFLQGRPIDRDVFVLPPEEARREGFIWRLRKTAYGLIDAARSWFMSVRDELLKAKCKQSQLDKAVFRWYCENKLEGIVLLHVDDFFMTGTVNFRRSVSDRITT